MVCHDISFASTVFWLFARLSCRALLLNGAFKGVQRHRHSGVSKLLFHLWSIIFGPTLQEQGGGPEKASRHRLLGTWNSWQVVDFNGSGVACDETLSSRVGHLPWDCLTIQSAVKYVGHTTPRGHAAHFYLKSALFKKPLELRLERCENIKSFRNDFKIFTTWKFDISLASCVLPVPVVIFVAAVDDENRFIFPSLWQKLVAQLANRAAEFEWVKPRRSVRLRPMVGETLANSMGQMMLNQQMLRFSLKIGGFILVTAKNRQDRDIMSWNLGTFFFTIPSFGVSSTKSKSTIHMAMSQNPGYCRYPKMVV